MYRSRYLSLDLATDYQEISEKKFGELFLKTWLNAKEDLRPDEFYYAEGVRKKYLVVELGLEGLLNEWFYNCSMFKRKQSPKFNGSIHFDTNLKHYERKGIKYHNVFTIFFPMANKSEYILELFKLFLPVFHTKFGQIDANFVSDQRYKFVKKTETRKSTKSFGYYVGTNPEYGLDFTIPQISWVNFLGNELVELIGENKFRTLKAYHIEKICEGYLIISYPSHKTLGTPEGFIEEERIMQHLGRHYFFDRKKIDEKTIWSDEEDFFDNTIISSYLKSEIEKG